MRCCTSSCVSELWDLISSLQYAVIASICNFFSDDVRSRCRVTKP